MALDRDGAARFEYPVIAYRGDDYPSFALEVAREYLGVPRDRVRLELGHGIALGDRFLPTDDTMRLPVNYRRPGRFRSLSAARLLAGDTEGLALDGKVVLIGGAAAGIGETFLTPFSPVLPSVERHAMVIDSIVRQDFLVRRDVSGLLDLGLLAVGGLIIGWLAGRQGLLVMTLGFAALGAGRRGPQPLGVPCPRRLAQPVPAAPGPDRDLGAGPGLQLLHRPTPGAAAARGLQALSEPGRWSTRSRAIPPCSASAASRRS